MRDFYKDVRGTHDLIEKPSVIVEHKEPLNELALAEKYVPAIFDYTRKGCGDKHISHEDTSIWDPGSIDTSGVDTRDPGWHWDLRGVFNHSPVVNDDYGINTMIDPVMKHSCSFTLPSKFWLALVASWFDVCRLREMSWHIAHAWGCRVVNMAR